MCKCLAIGFGGSAKRDTSACRLPTGACSPACLEAGRYNRCELGRSRFYEEKYFTPVRFSDVARVVSAANLEQWRRR